jgi:hypothetical protein
LGSKIDPKIIQPAVGGEAVKRINKMTKQERIYDLAQQLFDLINDDNSFALYMKHHPVITPTTAPLEKVFDILESYADSLDDTAVE